MTHTPRATADYTPAQTAGLAGSRRIELVIPEALAGLRLDVALARALPQHSRSRIRQWLDAGCASVDGGSAEPTRRVHGGERVAIEPPAARDETAFRPEAIPLNIVYEDDSIIVVDKPAGMVVHPGSGNWQGTLLNALLEHAPQLSSLPRAGIVHRLDKDTSGLLVVAKTPEAQTALVRQLQSRTVTREYVALVEGDLDRGATIDAPIGRHPRRRTEMAVVATGKPAVTRFEVVERFGGTATLIRCRLETGRTHQIRVHLAAHGHPIVGDPVYGHRRGRRRIAHPRQALHATRLALDHPQTGDRREWSVPIPPDLERLVTTLRGPQEALLT